MDRLLEPGIITMIETDSPADSKKHWPHPLHLLRQPPPLPISADVPIGDALAQASDLLFLIKPFAENVDYDKKPPAIPRALISWRR